MAGAGYKLYSTGEVLSATDVNTYLQQQTVMVFASSTARTTALSGVLAEGMISYLQDTNSVEVYNGTAWVSVGGASGLTLVKSQTIGSAVSSVTVTDAFSSTYTNYRVMVTGTSQSSDQVLQLTLGSTATDYYLVGFYQNFGTSTVNGFSTSNTTYFHSIYGGTNGSAGVIEILKPQVAARTNFTAISASPTTTGFAAVYNGFLNNATQYTAFTLTPASGTITGGEIRVYGYQNS